MAHDEPTIPSGEPRGEGATGPGEGAARPSEGAAGPGEGAAGAGEGAARPGESAAGPDQDSPGPAGGSGPRRLTRSADDRVIGGVAGGLGRYFGIDPIIFRIGFAAATLVGGAGVLVYVAALLFVPSEPGGETPTGARRLLAAAGAALLALAAVVLVGDVLDPLAFGGLGTLIVIAVAGFVIWWLVERRDGEPGEAGRMLGRVALAIGLLAVAAVAASGSAWAAATGSGAAIAALVIVIGVLLTAAAFRGGARWLIAPALVLAIPLGFVSAADLSFEGGFGERAYRPGSAAEVLPEYRLGAGELVVDLRQVELPPGERRLRIDLGAGEAVVLVPRGVCVATDAKIGFGHMDVLDREQAGFDVALDERPAASAATPRLVVAADVAMGSLEIATDEPRSWRRDEGPFGRHDRFDSADRLGPPPGCSAIAGAADRARAEARP